MTTKTDLEHSPRIYVASLSDYNAGRLHGCWINANQDAAAIRQEITAMLAQSREEVAEEWAIHDHDNFAGYDVPEFADMEHVAEVASLIAEHGRVFAGLLDHSGGNVEEARGYMEEGYCGEYDDLGSYALQLMEDLYHDGLEALPSLIQAHIDWDAVGRDLEIGGDIFSIEDGGSIHVFNAHV